MQECLPVGTEQLDGSNVTQGTNSATLLKPAWCF